MNAADVLVRALERNTDSFLKMVHRVPADKLAWSPAEGVRSALDQFQEVATLVGDFWGVYADRKLELSPEIFGEWTARRSAMTDVEALETRLRADTQRLIEHIRTLSPEELEASVQMPWPGDYRVVDTIQMHTWNLSYHEGQISGLLQHLGIDPMA